MFRLPGVSTLPCECSERAKASSHVRAAARTPRDSCSPERAPGSKLTLRPPVAAAIAKSRGSIANEVGPTGGSGHADIYLGNPEGWATQEGQEPSGNVDRTVELPYAARSGGNPRVQLPPPLDTRIASLDAASPGGDQDSLSPPPALAADKDGSREGRRASLLATLSPQSPALTPPALLLSSAGGPRLLRPRLWLPMLVLAEDSARHH